MLGLVKRYIRQLLRKAIGYTEPIAPSVPPKMVLGDEALLMLGQNVSFGGNVVINITAPVHIGDNTMVARNTIIHTVTHNYHLNPMWMEHISRPVKIGRDVWIGTGAVILGGVIIEDFAVVGAGAVITKNVPSGAIVAGNPARIIKYRDNIEELKKSPLDTTALLEKVVLVDKGFKAEYLK